MKKQHILVEKPVIMVGIVAIFVSITLYISMSASNLFTNAVDSLTSPIKEEDNATQIYQGRYR